MSVPRTVKWHKKELASVNGYDTVYTVTPQGEIYFRLIGGGTARPYTLAQQGFVIKMPEILRPDVQEC